MAAAARAGSTRPTFLYDADRAFDDREQHHLQEPRGRRLGPVRGRDRDHRPRLAHDVAAHRPQAPDVRRGAGREVRRRDREDLPARRRPRGPDPGQAAAGHRVHRDVRPRLPLLPPRREPQHLAGRRTATWCSRARRGAKKSLADLFGRGQVLGGRGLEPDARLRGGPGPDLLQPARPRGAGHRLRGRGVQGAAGRDRGQARRSSRDPDTGEPVMRAVYRRDDIYKGEYLQNAPDLQVGFNDGYRVGWQDTHGRRSAARWWRTTTASGAATTAPPPPRSAAACFFANRKIATPRPHIMDLAPTILKLLEVPAARRTWTASPCCEAGRRRCSRSRRWPRGRRARSGRAPPAPRRRPAARRHATSACARSSERRQALERDLARCAARRRACSARWSGWSWRCGCAASSCARRSSCCSATNEQLDADACGGCARWRPRCAEARPAAGRARPRPLQAGRAVLPAPAALRGPARPTSSAATAS